MDSPMSEAKPAERCKCGHLATGGRDSRSWTCGSPRCESGLPRKFSDRECEAYVWLLDKPSWLVDLIDKSVTTPRGKYANLIQLAQEYGWDDA